MRCDTGILIHHCVHRSIVVITLAQIAVYIMSCAMSSAFEVGELWHWLTETGAKFLPTAYGARLVPIGRYLRTWDTVYTCYSLKFRTSTALRQLRHLQAWRLIMPVFLHVGIVHLLFNVLFILVGVFEHAHTHMSM